MWASTLPDMEHPVEVLVNAIIESVLARYRTELPEYGVLDDTAFHADVGPMVRWHSDVVLAALETTYQPDPAIFRNSAIRRFHQGIPVQALMHSYELWASELWRHCLRAWGTENGAERMLVLSGVLQRHVETARSSVMRIYADEAAGRTRHEPLRPDLLDVLISTDEANEFIQRLIATLRLDLEIPHALVLLRPRSKEAGHDDAESALATVRKVLDRALCHPVVSGIHGQDVVAISALQQGSHQRLLEAADDVARELPEFVVGVSRSYFSMGGFAHGYLEAQSAINYAPSRAEKRAYSSSEAVVNRILRQSDLVEELRRETVGPLEKYDEAHGAELLVTLQTYAECHFSLKAAASRLHVQPNTVRYRLQRVKDLTGHDPLTSHGVFVLLAGIRLIVPHG